MTSPVSARRAAPTLEAVAAEAGVSRSTVSRVVNGSTQVRPDVITAVNAAIERLHYVPNRAARSLANRQTMAIALVVVPSMAWVGLPEGVSLTSALDSIDPKMTSLFAGE